MTPQFKKHLDVRALEALMKNWPDCQNTPEGRRIYRFIAPRAERALHKRVKRVKPKGQDKQAIPRAPNQQARKRLLKEECESLCKKIVWARDSIDGVPTCVTSGDQKGPLQWGHFISRRNCKALIYDPANSGIQSLRDNIFGQGEYAKFRDAINARSPGLAEKLEAFSKANQNFTWTVLALEAQKAKLLAIIQKMGVQ